MSSNLYIIGGLNEKELMAVDYAETPESGKAGVTRKYKAEEYGWMRETNVKIIVVCWRKDIDDVLDAFPTSPTNLTSNPGKNADGSRPARVQWGSGFVLQKVSPGDLSPSMVKLSAEYTREVPEAQDALPSGMTITCSSGEYSVVWQSNTFKKFDTGAGSCGTAGLEFVKMPQRKDKVEIITVEDGTTYSETVYRYMNILEVRFDGVKFESHEVLARTESVVAKKSASAQAAQEKKLSEAALSDDYQADLHWYVDGNTCRLIWCDVPIWSFSIP